MIRKQRHGDGDGVTMPGLDCDRMGCDCQPILPYNLTGASLTHSGDLLLAAKLQTVSLAATADRDAARH